MPQPLILSTWSFGMKSNAAGWPVLTGGGSALDAVEQACRFVERDASVDSVGYGGLPDRTGRVSLDGCIMLSPSQCGSVCFVRKFMHPVSIARRVMEKTPHVMLAGQGAEDFALSQGFEVEELLSPEAAARYEEKRAELQANPSLEYRRVIGAANREERGRGTGDSKKSDSGLLPPEPPHDTVGVLAIDSRGQLAGACSTSGLPMKHAGRVGDSPIIGHGLYVHPKHGAAVATGNGELVMGTCGSFLAVECMRRGATPEQALRECMARHIESFDLNESHQIGMIALTPAGHWAHLSLRPGYRTAIRSGAQNELIESVAVLA